MIQHLPIELHSAAAAVFRADFINGIRFGYLEKDHDVDNIAAAFDTLFDYANALDGEIKKVAVELKLA